jgi:hypothetical protein
VKGKYKMNREHIVQQAFAQGSGDGYWKRGFKCPFWWGKARKWAYKDGYELGSRKRAWEEKRK